MKEPKMSDEELQELLDLASTATPRPWFVRELDDQYAACLVAISTKPDSGTNERWPDFDPGEMVAATIIQNPNRYVSIADNKWDENARYIVAAATVLPSLIEELLELRRQATEGPDSSHR
jgi:hypothetical protein